MSVLIHLSKLNGVGTKEEILTLARMAGHMHIDCDIQVPDFNMLSTQVS